MMTPLEWMLSGDTGVSSQTILHVMTRTRMGGHFGPGIPYDPGDFGRCYRLLKHFPEWRARLDEMTFHYPVWKPLVEHWDELTALYEEEINRKDKRAPKLYARMRELIDGGKS